MTTETLVVGTVLPLPEIAVPDFDGLVVVRRGRGGQCPGYPASEYRDGVRKPHERHRWMPVRFATARGWHSGGKSPADQYGELAARWGRVRDGFVCSTCWDAFKPVPRCERHVYGGVMTPKSQCTNPATRREIGLLATATPLPRDGDTSGLAPHNYCGAHAPSREIAKQARRAAADAAWQHRWDESNARREAEERREQALDALVTEAMRWRDDEQSTEGFCDDCEHHECRLARAVAAYEATL